MLKQSLVALVVGAVAACSRAPSAPRSTDHSQPDTAKDQLAAFQLQTACASEARAWLNERQRNEGYNPNATEAGSYFIIDLRKTHYSLARHGCFAVVEEQTTVSGGGRYVFSLSRKLYPVDGNWEPVAEVSGATTDAMDTVTNTVLLRDIKSCSVGNQKCDSLGTWELWTQTYLEQ